MRYEWKNPEGRTFYVEGNAVEVTETTAGPDDLEAHKELLRVEADRQRLVQEIEQLKLALARSEDGEHAFGWSASFRDGENVRVDLIYPRIQPAKAVIVGLEDVRAADEILVRYDFDRDGWSISQPSVSQWAADDEVCDPQWKEVAFVRAWAQDENK